MGKIYVNDIPLIKLDTGADLIGATVTQIKYKKPSGATGHWIATVVSSTYLQYQTVDGDIDEAGIWCFQNYVSLPSWHGYGEEYHIHIHQPETA